MTTRCIAGFMLPLILCVSCSGGNADTDPEAAPIAKEAATADGSALAGPSQMHIVAAPAPSGVAAQSLGETLRPNVVFILVDDLGYGQLGLTGSDVVETPNIDALAARGVTFSHAYAGSTVCSPSRISLMTGKDTGALHSNANTILLRPGDRTMAHMLSAAGYETGLFGKWGIGVTFGQTDPMTMGFETWYGLLHNITAHRQYPTMVFEDNEMLFVPGNVAGAEGAYAQRLFTDQALKFLEGRDAVRPFFLYLSYTSPHAELAAPQDLIDQYTGAYPDTPYPGLSGDGEKPRFADYYPKPVDAPNATTAAMIATLDGYVGEIAAALDDAGLTEDTIIVFTSDNGPHAEGGADPLATAAAAPYRGGKRDLYDGGIHIPFVLSWPGHADGGRVIDTPISFADVLPTLADAAGAGGDAMAGLAPTGTSLLPLLAGEALPDRTLYWEFARQIGDPNSGVTAAVTQAARQGRYKAVRLAEDAPTELYDILDDPDESEDLAKADPERAARFAALFDERLAN